MTKEVKDAILKVLDFIERNNKQDAEVDVANAAETLESYLEDEYN